MRNIIKRVGAFTMGLAVSVSLMGGALAYSTPDFADVPAANWAYEPVMKMADAGIIKGSSPTTFSPEMKVSPAMWLTLVGRAVYEADAKVAAQAGDEWFTAYVRVAQSKGLTTGTNITDANLQGEMTRYDMAATVYAAIKRLGVKDVTVDTAAIKDYGMIPNMYTTAVTQVYATGLIKGDNAGNFNGNNTMTRAEAATVMDRLITLRNAKSDFTPEVNDGKVYFTVKGRALVDGVPTAGVKARLTSHGVSIATAVSDQDGWCTFEAVESSYSYSLDEKQYYAMGTYTDASGTKYSSSWENITEKSLAEQQNDFDCVIVTQPEMPPRTGETETVQIKGAAFLSTGNEPAPGANIKLCIKGGRVLGEGTADSKGKFDFAVTMDKADYSDTADQYYLEVRWTAPDGLKWSNVHTDSSPSTTKFAEQDGRDWRVEVYHDSRHDQDF